MSQALINTHGPTLQAYWDNLPEEHQDHLTENPSRLASMIKDFFDEIDIEISNKTADWIAGGLITGAVNLAVSQGGGVILDA